MCEEVLTKRGCPEDIYKYGLMKEFNESRHKYEPLCGHRVYVKRESIDSPIKVFKTLNDKYDFDCVYDPRNGPIYSCYIPYDDDIPEHQMKDSSNYGYDESIKVEYLGTDIDLNIKEGDHAIIKRRDNGELYVLITSKEFKGEFLQLLQKPKSPLFMRTEPYKSSINSDGLVYFKTDDKRVVWQ